MHFVYLLSISKVSLIAADLPFDQATCSDRKYLISTGEFSCVNGLVNRLRRKVSRVVYPITPYQRHHYSQNGEDIILQRIFKGKRNGFYIDAGAHHPNKFSNTSILDRDFGWQGLNIDASPENIEIFNQQRPRDINIAVFLSEHAGEEIEFKHFQGGLGSTGINESRISPSWRGRILRKEKLKSLTLDELIEEHCGDKEINLLDLDIDIDIEGFDFKVLRSLDWSKRQFNVICIEDFGFRENSESKIFLFLDSRAIRACLIATIRRFLYISHFNSSIRTTLFSYLEQRGNTCA
ncbi:hypothetical protein EY643_01735 [Halioglobus maricola]|uniref:Methyltransferase FkbM domain-containing protein n=1 Tax=Halioglobus maricola TaxID=2601894 RepID=A0A5P9NFB4_9GAMM|nr:FkbM family methyltransferase [Halioglobus maricola]QFU74477.1 hypothetical protein EY643_01735 [Halioglobus maricola]